MSVLLTKLNNIYENISQHAPQNRVDGTLIGNTSELLANILPIIYNGCKIFIIGDIKNNTLFYNRQNRHCLTIKDNNNKIFDLLQNSYIEVLYIFDENYEPLILIDDFPEDVTINVKLLSLAKIKSQN